jgi:hypothetical protein
VRLEVHIIIAQLHLDAMQPDLHSDTGDMRAPLAPVLPALADQVRAVAAAAARAVGVTADAVDVFIDDIR